MTGTEEHGSLGEAFASFCRGIVSLLTTGSWVVEGAADNARSTELLRERIPEAAEQDAQRTLQIVDEGLTSFGLLKQKLERAKQQKTDWDKRVETGVSKYKACTDPEQKAKLGDLVKQALTERKKTETLVSQLQAAVDEAGPDAEAALKAAEQAGLRREAALSQVEVLSIQDASAKARHNLARAAQGDGNSQATELLAELGRKVQRHQAEACAGQQIADALPKSAEQIGAELDDVTAHDDIEAEFAELVGN
ncbi:MAG: hypothetical protein WC080_02185 [Patescibacteria group bacterium]|jgi:phage shock protein A